MMKKKPEKKSLRQNTVLRRFIALILVLCGIITVIMAFLFFTDYIVSTLASTLYKMAGVSFSSALAVKELSVNDLLLLGMVWGFPCMAMAVFFGIVAYKTIVFLLRKIVVWLKILCGRETAGGKVGSPAEETQTTVPEK